MAIETIFYKDTKEKYYFLYEQKELSQRMLLDSSESLSTFQSGKHIILQHFNK